MPFPRRRPTGGPVVVFVDLGMMLSFDQLASRLRGRGVRTVHLTMSDNPLAMLASRVLYRRTHVWRSPRELSGLLSGVGPSAVVDVQCPEALLDDVLAAATAAALPTRTVDILRGRHQWQDKAVATARLLEAGLPVPRSLVLRDAGREALVAALGLPLVLKTAVSSGGEGVRLVRTAGELPGAIESLGVGEAHLHAEEFLPGETLCWAGVTGDDGVLASCVYRTRQAREAEGPSSVIEVVEDPEVDRIGRAVARTVAVPGPINLDLVRDADGRPRVVDVNLRVWHSIVALEALGHDFTGAYRAALGLGPVPAGSGGTGPVHVFPDQGAEDLAVSRRRGTVRFVRDAWGQRHVLPPRYLAVQAVLFARRLLDRRPSGAAGDGPAA